MKWHELSWPRIKELDKHLPVLIPLGSIEQHGLHLPLCTDTVQVDEIATRVEARLDQCVVRLPTLWIGSSHHHRHFPGTLSLSPAQYTRVIEEITSSILGAGFRRLFFLNGHGGNETPVAQALSNLASTDELASNSLLTMSSWWTVGAPDAEKLNMATPGISHACEYETSLMLWLRPHLVDLTQSVDVDERLETSWLRGVKRVSVFRRFSRMTATGNLGMPTKASADKGEAMLRAVVDDVVAFLSEFATWPLPASLELEEARK